MSDNKPPPRGGYVDPNYPSPGGPQDATIIIYGYIPALALCVLGIILYTVSLCLHTFLLFRYRLWSFSPLALGCTLEVVGYIFRVLSSQRDPYNIIYFVVQYFCIVTAPVFISASIYVCLSKLIRWADSNDLLLTESQLSNSTSAEPESNSRTGIGRALPKWLFSPRGILYLFITIDILSTITQVAGAALIGSYESNRKDPKKPNDILLAGLAIQTASFTVYILLLLAFRYKISSTPPPSSPISLRTTNSNSTKTKSLAEPHHGNAVDTPARTDKEATVATSTSKADFKEKDPFIIALFIASLLIYLRTIFRLAETAEGVYGYLSTHEAFFGALEFAPVVVAVWILALWHPGRWIGRDALLRNP